MPQVGVSGVVYVFLGNRPLGWGKGGAVGTHVESLSTCAFTSRLGALQAKCWPHSPKASTSLVLRACPSLAPTLHPHPSITSLQIARAFHVGPSVLLDPGLAMSVFMTVQWALGLGQLWWGGVKKG